MSRWGQEGTLVVYLMSSWDGGSDMWIRPRSQPNEMYHVYHCTCDRYDAWSPQATWYYRGKFDWLATLSTARPKAKAKAKAGAKALTRPKAKAKAKAKATIGKARRAR